MNPLARLDLSRFRIDAESFVGQAIALGVEFDRLPGQTGEALLGFLRAKGLYYGKRNRTGIAIGREGLERGVRQALICLDLGLKDRAEGDLNQAVELLRLGDFEVYRKRGYELAFFRLVEMQKESTALLGRPEAQFLQVEYKYLKQWSKVAPELWTRRAEEGEEEDHLVDPRGDYEAFLLVRGQMDFLRSIPGEALRDLQLAVSDGRTFDGLLRNVILALALDMEGLVPSGEQIGAFEARCFEGGQMKPEVREKVLHLMDRQLAASVEDAGFRGEIRRVVEEEIAFLEAASGDDLTGFFLLPGQKAKVVGDVEMAPGE